MSVLDIAIPLKVVKVPWCAATENLNVFSGGAYNHRCVCAVGSPADDRVALKDTRSPRDRLYDLRRGHKDDRLIVLDLVWSVGKTAAAVLAAAQNILEKAGQAQVDGWFRIPRSYIRSLLLLASDKAGVKVQTHDQFAMAVKDFETGKLRNHLAKVGVDPDVVAAHRYI